jgi:hypothetical protein
MTESEIENVRLVPVQEITLEEKMNHMKKDCNYLVEWIQRMAKEEAKDHPSLKDIVKSSETIDELMESYQFWKKQKSQRRRSWASEFVRLTHKIGKLMRTKYDEENYVEGGNIRIFDEGTARFTWTWEKKKE